MVTVGSCIVAMDGIMGQLGNRPRTEPDWTWNSPSTVVQEWLPRHPDFAVEAARAFNEGAVKKRATYWPNCFLKRTRRPVQK